AKGLFSLAVVLFTPMMGRLMDRIGPARLAARSFGLLALYSAMLLLVQNAWSYALVETFWGVAMSGVGIVWNMGPVTLAPEGEARRYMSIHVALVGLRALIGHPLGGILTRITGDPRWVFLVAIGFLLAATWVMTSLGRDLQAKR
ncbi:MAG: MFS transporter, partial [Planctomycetota bacterium]